jgi:uncharacterized YccA/Bax inhibitor family protein
VGPSSEQKLLTNDTDEAILKRIIRDALVAHEKKRWKREVLMFSYTTLITAYLGAIAILLSVNPSESIADVSFSAAVLATILMIFCDFLIWGLPFIQKKND